MGKFYQSSRARKSEANSQIWPIIKLIQYLILVLVTWKFYSELINQRTGGPVNAHLTPGPGIYFNAFIHVYSPRVGADKPLGTNIDVNRKALITASLLQVLKQSVWSMILNTFYCKRARAENPLGTNFWCQQKAVITLLQVSNKSLWILILYTFLNIFPHVYSPGAGKDNPLWTKSWCQQKSLVTLPICCKFQINIFEVWFYT